MPHIRMPHVYPHGQCTVGATPRALVSSHLAVQFSRPWLFLPFSQPPASRNPHSLLVLVRHRPRRRRVTITAASPSRHRCHDWGQHVGGAGSGILVCHYQFPSGKLFTEYEKKNNRGRDGDKLLTCIRCMMKTNAASRKGICDNDNASECSCQKQVTYNNEAGFQRRNLR